MANFDIQIYFKPLLFVVDGQAKSGKLFDHCKDKICIREDNTGRLWQVGFDNVFDITGKNINLKEYGV